MDYDAFARSWCRAWNDHDVEQVLAHFHDEAVFISPIAASMWPSTNGRMVGKRAIREYWVAALARVPDLHFEIDHLSAGTGILVIQYQNQNGIRVAEVLRFEDGLVIEGYGTYPLGTANPAGLSG